MVPQIFQRVALAPIVGMIEQIPKKGIRVLPMNVLDGLHGQVQDRRKGA